MAEQLQNKKRAPEKIRNSKSNDPSQQDMSAMKPANNMKDQKRKNRVASKCLKPGKSSKPEKCTTNSDKTFRSLVAMNFHQLDPLTGDASCEMRVPFILDAIDIFTISGYNMDNLAIGFASMYGPEFNMLPADIGGSLPKEMTMPEYYFSFFYPLSVTRQRAQDSLHFIIDDRNEVMTYPTQVLNRWKMAAAKCNVNYMQKLAEFQSEMVGHQSPVLRQICRGFHESKIKVNIGGYRQPILPIFEAEYFLLQNEYLHGRPIVLVLTRWGYDTKGGQYHYGTKVYMYRPNDEEDFSKKGFNLDRGALDTILSKKSSYLNAGFQHFSTRENRTGRIRKNCLFHK